MERLARRYGAKRVLSMLSDAERERLMYLWRAWARPEQLAPPGIWRVWALIGGRGMGKTRTLNEWLRERVERGQARRIALVAKTPADVRDVLIEGESGILAVSPPSNRPVYEPSKRRLTWPNGALALAFTSYEPDQLRGPQFDTAVCDECAAWKYPRDTWDNLQLTMRLGDPRIAVATTPRPVSVLKEILESPHTVVTRGTTYSNRANLAEAFLQQIITRYEGTRLGAQELLGELLEDMPGALWRRAMFEPRRQPPRKVNKDGKDLGPDLVRVVVAIDPAVTSGPDSDETGIVVAGKGPDGHGYVLDDRSLRASPDAWAKRAVAAYHEYKADRIIAESNNGGEMVRLTLRTVDPDVPVTLVTASRGKRARAEPIAALYEQCVSVGTPVATEYGDLPIEQVKRGLRVWTRKGLRLVRWAGRTGHGETIIIRTSRGSLICTGNHPVYIVGRGFVHASTVVPKQDMMLAWKPLISAQTAGPLLRSEGGAVVHAPLFVGGRRVNRAVNSWSSMESAIFSKQMAIGELADIRAERCSIARFGSTKSVHCLTQRTFTTSMATREITALRTWHPSAPVNINHRPMQFDDHMRLKFENAYPRNGVNGGQGDDLASSFATNADRLLKVGGSGCASVPRAAIQPIGIVAAEPGPRVPLYDLAVDGEPEYFAGGLLVHNCKVSHVRPFRELEDQLCTFVPGEGDDSPDRHDALVWALSAIMYGYSGDPLKQVVFA